MPRPCGSGAHQLTSPALVIHGTDDMVSPIERGRALAAATGGDLLVLEGSGHIPLARDPVKVNLAIKEFVDRLAPRRAGRTDLDAGTVAAQAGAVRVLADRARPCPP